MRKRADVKKKQMSKNYKKPAMIAGCVVKRINNATFCNNTSPHQELIDKIKAYDLSCHTPTECINFVYELKKLIESYG